MEFLYLANSIMRVRNGLSQLFFGDCRLSFLQREVTRVWRRVGDSNTCALSVRRFSGPLGYQLPIPSAWSAGPDSNRVRRGLQSRASTTSASGANFWQGTRDSNSAIPGLESGALPIEPVPRGAWYPRRDLNPHVRRRQFLRLVCLPFHHPGTFW